jgi:hypothetical protein
MLRQHQPVGQVIAFAGTNYTLPLQGRTFGNRVMFISPAPSIEKLADLPPLGKQTANNLDQAVHDVIYGVADHATWLRRIIECRPTLLVIGSQRPVPERAWALNDPAHFQKMFENDRVTIFAFRPASTSASRR